MILLDEPFTGVDPIAVNEVQDIVLKLKNKGSDCSSQTTTSGRP